MKKFFSAILSLVMVLATGQAVFAATPADYSITVQNAMAGETYTAYKMFDLSVDDPTNPTAYRYTVNSAWESFKSDSAFTAVFTVDSQWYVTANEEITDETDWTVSGKISVLAEKAAAYAKNQNLTAAGSVTISAGETSGKINLTEAGYYVVTSTLGTRAMTETTPAEPAVTITEKNEADTIVKTVKEDSTSAYGAGNDAQIGDTVEFKSVVTIVPRSVNVIIHDTMDSGLTLNPNSIKVYTAYTDETTNTPYTDATIRYAGATAGEPNTGDTFTIGIPDTFAETAEGNQTLTIIYTAELNAGAVSKDDTGVKVVNQNNKTTVTSGAGTSSVESNTTTTTHSATIFKHAAESTENLANAIFALKKNGTVVNLMKLNDENYRMVDDTDTTDAVSHVDTSKAGTDQQGVNTIAADTIVSDFVTVSTGKITIWGLDSDSDYTITELQAPNGYNLLADPVTLTYNTDTTSGGTVGFKEADITNNTGTELPTTGGIGTTIFYIVGGILVVGAIVFFIARRRMKLDGEASE